MLREIANIQQVPGEPQRRWFFSHDQDLLVWLDSNGTPVAFQLAYGKYRNERALRWKAGTGFTHEVVDDGENSGVVKQAAVLDGHAYFDAAAVRARFVELSTEVPPEIVAFVCARLEEHPNFGPPPEI